MEVIRIGSLVFTCYGRDNSSLCECIDFGLYKLTLIRAFLTIRGDPVAVGRIVVVDVASAVHIAHVVRISGVRRPNITTVNPSSYICHYRLCAIA